MGRLGELVIIPSSLQQTRTAMPFVGHSPSRSIEKGAFAPWNHSFAGGGFSYCGGGSSCITGSVIVEPCDSFELAGMEDPLAELDSRCTEAVSLGACWLDCSKPPPLLSELASLDVECDGEPELSLEDGADELPPEPEPPRGEPSLELLEFPPLEPPDPLPKPSPLGGLSPPPEPSRSTGGVLSPGGVSPPPLSPPDFLPPLRPICDAAPARAPAAAAEPLCPTRCMVSLVDEPTGSGRRIQCHAMTVVR